MSASPTVGQRLVNAVMLGFAALGRITPAQVVPAAFEADTAGARDIAATDLLGGYYRRECSGGARTDTLPSAADLTAALATGRAGTSPPPIGTHIDVTVHNISAAANTLTIANGTGVTVVGTATAAQGVVAHFRLMRSGDTAYTFTRMG